MPSTEHLDQGAQSRTLERGAIPNLDLEPLFGDDAAARDLLSDRIHAACLAPGFFCVHNSSVPDRLIRRALYVAETFFGLPDDSPVKQAVHNEISGGMKGWGPIFGEPAYQEGTVAHVESFDLGQELSGDQHQSSGIAPNVWPEVAGFREAVLDYYAAVTRLGRALAEVFSVMLGEERNFINRHSNETAPRTMRLLHYPANHAAANPRQVGIAAHTDFECFTIMNQTAAGLELTDEKGQWCAVPSDIGTFTVILGDMMERFSNGHLKATGHRVADTPWERYSMVLFFAVDNDFGVAPLPRFTGAGNPAIYPPITQGEHIRRELARAMANRENTVDPSKLP